ncbi:hypothetical protein K8R32_00660 [bacterium]|nr:hypothetical protein [bacterium]
MEDGIKKFIAFIFRWSIRIGILVFLLYLFTGTNFGIGVVKKLAPDIVLEKVEWVIKKADEYLPAVKERIAKLLEKKSGKKEKLQQKASNKPVKEVVEKVTPGKSNKPKSVVDLEIKVMEKTKGSLNDPKLAKEVKAMRQELAVFKADLAKVMQYQSVLADIERRVLKTEGYPNADIHIQNLEAITHNLDKRLKTFTKKK